LEVLEAYRAGAGQVSDLPKTRPGPYRMVARFPVPPVWQVALAASLLIGGVFLGRYGAAIQPSAAAPEVAQLKGEVESLRQLVALSMLQQQSPSARLRGVSYSEAMTQPDRQVEEALLYAVNHDSNVNVRLSAVDALQKFATPDVIRAMVDAIPVQDSPLVQIALLDMLVQLNASSARPELTKLSQNAQVDEVVRQRAVWALQKLAAQKQAVQKQEVTR
jgi:hypothetical protein